MSSPLERRYRRLLRVLPKWYRRDREDEMVATLLEDRQDRLDRGPGLGEALAVLGLAMRTRLPTTVPARTVAAGNAARAIALFGLAIASVMATYEIVIWLDVVVNGYPQFMTARHLAVLLLGHLAVPAAFTAVMLGRIGWARALGVVALVPGAIDVVTDARSGRWTVFSTEVTAEVTLWLAVACLFLAATRAVGRASRLWWWAGAGAVLLGIGYELMPTTGPTVGLWLQFFQYTLIGWAVALGCVGYLTVVRRRFDAAGSGALALSAAALVTVVAQSDELVVGSEGGAYGFAAQATTRYVVFAGLTGLLLVLVVLLATIGIRRYWSLPHRRLAAGVE
ncbi:MAG TPA: hypothetical protein VGM75_24760 [Pseudonocardiaceae bacterium]